MDDDGMRVNDDEPSVICALLLLMCLRILACVFCSFNSSGIPHRL